MTDLSDEDVRDIAGRASTIDERRAGGCTVSPPSDEAGRERVRARLAAWRQAAAAGDEALFARRLAAEGLDERAAAELLGMARLTDGQPLPQWARCFAWAAAAMGRPDSLALERRDPQAEPPPFEELLRPVVAAADRRLARRRGDPLRRHFSAEARRSLRDSLLTRLAAVAGRGLFNDFVVFRHVSSPMGLPFWSPRSRALYAGYIGSWREGRGRAFFLTNPVAARLIGMTVLHWLEAMTELVDRLERDQARLAETFFGGAPLGPVISLDCDLSDPHHRGRAVAILGFSHGRKLVYKPKDLRIDSAWADLLSWLDARGAPIRLRTPKTFVGDGYGWVEFIAADEAERAGDPVLFHRRAGGVLALLHAFRGVDFHYENVITVEDCPVPIDLETLFHPRLVDPGADDATDPAGALAAAQAVGSVLGTLYLPLWVSRPGGVGAIGGLDAPGRRYDRTSAFRDANTDAMALASGGPPPDAQSQGGAALAAHAADFIRGFGDLYRFLLHHRDALAAADGPLSRFRGLQVRVLLGSTLGYVLIERRAAEYANLGDGADWSLQFDFRCRMYLTLEASPENWRLLAAERRAMARLDVPLFTADTGAGWLEACDGERIEACLDGSPFDQVLDRLASLGEADRLLQERLARSAIGSAGLASPSEDRVVTREPDFLAAALRLGQSIKASAIRTDGHASWIGVTPVDHDHSVVSPLGYDFYSGASGIALFLAALWRCSGDTDYRDLALEALRAPRGLPDARDGGAQAARLLGIGGGTGTGSIVYGLVRAADLLAEPGLLGDASRYARLIDAGQIDGDRHHDVVDGAAGAILGLLALHRANGDPTALGAATACGVHLLQSRFVEPSHGAGPSSTAVQSGFSHGGAGVALALWRLSQASGDVRFRRAAIEALVHERRGFSAGFGGGPDLEASPALNATQSPGSWCYGAAGVGLARLGCLGLSEDADLPGEIEMALAITRDAPTAAVDHVCCGSLGRTDFLLTAGLRLDRPDLIELARNQAVSALARREARGGFTWRNGDDAINPGLFQGIAGIGYQLLRLRTPTALPSILLWD